jgi:hypothetical protein
MFPCPIRRPIKTDPDGCISIGDQSKGARFISVKVAKPICRRLTSNSRRWHVGEFRASKVNVQLTAPWLTEAGIAYLQIQTANLEASSCNS